MPAVLRQGPYRIYFYNHEPGEPPHVHVDRDAQSAKFWLQPVALTRNIGFPAHEIRRIGNIVESNQAALMEAWSGHFGA